jgi:hypothetical protein
MMDEIELERIYSQQLHEELINQTRFAITQVIQLCPEMFGLEMLIINKEPFKISISERITELYKEVCQLYLANGIVFDHTWVRETDGIKDDSNLHVD